MLREDGFALEEEHKAFSVAFHDGHDEGIVGFGCSSLCSWLILLFGACHVSSVGLIFSFYLLGGCSCLIGRSRLKLKFCIKCSTERRYS